MAEMIRVRIASDDTKYFEATDEMKQALFVNVVENTRVYNKETKAWEDGEPNWYGAKFQGRDADLINTNYQKGDSLVLVGERVLRETHKDGKVYRNTDFRVSAFGPDPRDAAVVLDRSLRPSRTRDQASEQWATQSADREAAPAADAETDLAEAEAALAADSGAAQQARAEAVADRQINPPAAAMAQPQVMQPQM